ncbi:hypothetical protein EYF80_018229 [Liparis tanakae]|uniref:Uncharacterized protein n=1 Tax=Liparis tanakae TaxID=230148 RepID=A0A4Z2I2S9_9TELE|nr:hypothetical protein EYF80_018229 [Liparis tanakae]
MEMEEGRVERSPAREREQEHSERHQRQRARLSLLRSSSPSIYLFIMLEAGELYLLRGAAGDVKFGRLRARAVGEWTPPPERHSTEGSNPPRLNLGPVKAVSHAGRGWMASEGERGKERDGVGRGKEQFAVEKG